MKTFPCFHGRKGCAFPGAVFFLHQKQKNRLLAKLKEIKYIRQTSKIGLTSILGKCRIWIEGREGNMKLSRKLPEAEFEIMKVVWEKEPPLTSTMLMEELKQTKDWKVPTLSSLLSRLVDRGYLRTEKNGKERTYYPLITEDE